jgi:hypothetical protein
MTMARSKYVELFSRTYPEEAPITERSLPAPQSNKPVRYPVSIFRFHGRNWDWKIGYVVTHLTLDEWAAMHSVKIQKVYPGTRIAQPGELTDLF